MPLGAQNVQTSERHYFVVLRFALIRELLVKRVPLVLRDLEDLAFVLKENHLHCRSRRFIPVRAVRADHRRRRRIRNRQLVFKEVFAGHRFRIAAQQNVRAAAGHVRRHSHGAFASRLRHDARFALVLLGVQHLVRHTGLLQNVRDRLRLFDRNRAHQHWLPTLVIVPDSVGQRIVFLQDPVHHRFKLFFFCAIHHIPVFLADQRAVRRDYHHVQVVNLPELRGFGFRRFARVWFSRSIFTPSLASTA